MQAAIAVEAESDPISGRVTNDAFTHSFTGWLELIALLELAFQPAPPPQPEASSTGDGE
jgi:hypothetical protein